MTIATEMFAPVEDRQADLVNKGLVPRAAIPAPATRRKTDDHPLLYIAGPMSGIPEWNFPAFFAAEKMLTDRGFRVLNPARYPAVEGESWESCLRRDLPDVLAADGLALLDKWWSSRGARFEVTIASTLQVPCEPLCKWIGVSEEWAA